MPQNTKWLENLWLKALMMALFGYATLGKGFAYFFVGEMILVFGVGIFLVSRRVMLVFSDSVLLLWAAFAFWGVCRTVPFLGRYHFDAVRDAVLWGYGVFALLIAAFVSNSNRISQALNTYRRFLRWYLPIVPFLLILTGQFRDKMPSIPWAKDVSIVFLKPADAAVHLCGAALFLLTFSDLRSGARREGVSIYRMIGFAGWSLGALLITAMSRGGLLAMMIPIILVSILRATRIGWKVAASGVLVVALSLIVLDANVIKVTFRGRSVTPDQIVENIGSLTGGSSQTGLEGNKAFRLVWWRHIVQYTFFGPYFWTGKGFGVNLALQDGPPNLSKEDTTLRSPHNGNMTVLARMGVPGLVIWAALNLTFAFRLFKGYRLATRQGSRFWSGVNLWILCYWLAALINMSFDVYLEGPQGGIWFWSIIGFGVAALRVQKYEARQRVAEQLLQANNNVDTEFVAVHA